MSAHAFEKADIPDFSQDLVCRRWKMAMQDVVTIPLSSRAYQSDYGELVVDAAILYGLDLPQHAGISAQINADAMEITRNNSMTIQGEI